MDTILYATDYSENSVAALNYAYNLSLEIDAKLMVIHVYDIPTILNTKSRGEIPNLEKDALREHTVKLKKFSADHLGSDLDNLNVKIEAIQDGSAVNGIVSKAKDIRATLIITGMTGASKFRKFIMGSTARNLIKTTPCPVLTIPENTNYTKIKTIIYATDFEEEDLGAINKLAEIAKPLDAKIKIVHISPVKESIGKGEKKALEEKINKHVAYQNVDLDILYSDDIILKLKLYYTKTNADIIAMLKRESSSFFEALFDQSLVEKMKSYGRIPLMSFNAKNHSIFHL